jgi:hypothetical protein
LERAPVGVELALNLRLRLVTGDLGAPVHAQPDEDADGEDEYGGQAECEGDVHGLLRWVGAERAAPVAKAAYIDLEQATPEFVKASSLCISHPRNL